MYKEVGTVPKKAIDKLKKILEGAEWKDNFSEGGGVETNRNFKTWTYDLFGATNRSFFLNIPAGGCVHRHKDAVREGTTYHIPVYTNDKSECWMYPDGREEVYHLEVGKIYEVDRQIEHDSRNLGETDRIHLLLETTIFPNFK